MTVTLNFYRIHVLFLQLQAIQGPPTVAPFDLWSKKIGVRKKKATNRSIDPLAISPQKKWTNLTLVRSKERFAPTLKRKD